MGVAVSGLLFVVATFAVTFGAYFLAHRWLHGSVDQEARDLSSSMVFRVAAMHGLILALVFSQELANNNAINAGVVREANQLEGVFKDLEFFNASGQARDDVAAIKATMKLYVEAIISDEWSSLNTDKRLNPLANDYWDQMYQQLLDLPASGDRQTWLRNRMLSKIDAIGLERDSREIAAATDINPIFWIVAFVGIAAIAAPYFVFEMNRVTGLLLIMYTAYVAAVLFFINMFDYPFSDFGMVRPAALQLFYEQYLQSVPVPGGIGPGTG